MEYVQEIPLLEGESILRKELFDGCLLVRTSKGRLLVWKPSIEGSTGRWFDA